MAENGRKNAVAFAPFAFAYFSPTFAYSRLLPPTPAYSRLLWIVVCTCGNAFVFVVETRLEATCTGYVRGERR